MRVQQDELYYGTRIPLTPGAQVPMTAGCAYFTSNLDAAIWAAELAKGEGEPKVYRVATSGPMEDVSRDPGFAAPPHPAMTWRTQAPLTIIDEVVHWEHYHGTRADLEIGDMIKPGHVANFGPTPRTANFVYFTRTLDASIWGAELAAGEGRSRIYVVEPTGPIEDDPNLTNVRFRGNPTKSFRSKSPLRVIGEVAKWEGHSPDAIRSMKEGLARLDQAGAAIDD